MRARLAPRILLPVHDRQPIIRDPIPAVLIDRARVRRGGDVERESADQGVVLQRQEAGDEGEAGGRGDGGPGLEVPPLGAVLVGPGAPGRGGEGVLGVEGGVVGVVGGVEGAVGGEGGEDVGALDVGDVV